MPEANVRYWPKADMGLCAANVRYWGQSGHLGRENVKRLSRYAIGPRSNGAKATAQSNWQKQAFEQAGCQSVGQLGLGGART